MALKVYAIDTLPPGIRLAHPVMVAAPNLDQAATILRVTRYHLSTHRLPMLDRADEERARAHPLERLIISKRSET